MADANVAEPHRASRRVLIFLILLLLVFLAGFVPMWIQERDQAALRLKAERSLALTRLENDLGSAAIDARRGSYEAARQEASAFFTAASYEIGQRGNSSLSEPRRDALASLLAGRDDVITLLARSDPAAADKLSSLYAALRKALGI